MPGSRPPPQPSHRPGWLAPVILTGGAGRTLEGTLMDKMARCRPPGGQTGKKIPRFGFPGTPLVSIFVSPPKPEFFIPESRFEHFPIHSGTPYSVKFIPDWQNGPLFDPATPASGMTASTVAAPARAGTADGAGAMDVTLTGTIAQPPDRGWCWQCRCPRRPPAGPAPTGTPRRSLPAGPPGACSRQGRWTRGSADGADDDNAAGWPGPGAMKIDSDSPAGAALT